MQTKCFCIAFAIQLHFSNKRAIILPNHKTISLFNKTIAMQMQCKNVDNYCAKTKQFLKVYHSDIPIFVAERLKT